MLNDCRRDFGLGITLAKQSGLLICRFPVCSELYQWCSVKFAYGKAPKQHRILVEFRDLYWALQFPKAGRSFVAESSCSAPAGQVWLAA